MNKKFILFFFLGIILSILILSSIYIFFLETDKKSVSYDLTSTFDSFKEKPLTSAYSFSGVKKILPFEEAQNQINDSFFNALLDLIIQYNINNLLDFQMYSGYTDKEYIPLSKQELKEDFLSNCYLTQNEQYGNIFSLHGKYMFFLTFSNDGKNVFCVRYFNFPTSSSIALDLSEPQVKNILEIAKQFLNDYSNGLANTFSPDTSYIDESGTVYVLEDNTNHISFSYSLLYKCPCGFRVGFP